MSGSLYGPVEYYNGSAAPKQRRSQEVLFIVRICGSTRMSAAAAASGSSSAAPRDSRVKLGGEDFAYGVLLGEGAYARVRPVDI
jgi:hypothetical protein